MKVGDLVTRGGDDVQRVIWVDDEGYLGTFECVCAPSSGWCKVGDRETNLCNRYSQTERTALRKL